MVWKKGQSGNPGGRPKTVGEVRELAGRHTPRVIEVLMDILENGSSDAARVAAGKELLDRACGKAVAKSEMDVRFMSDDELREEALRFAEMIREGEELQ